MRKIVFLASVLSLMIIVNLHADLKSNPPGATGLRSPSTNSFVNIDPTPVWVISPWGYGGFFRLRPGVNILQCPGTGWFFEHVPA